MHIMLEPAEVTACEISLELYTDIFAEDMIVWSVIHIKAVIAVAIRK